MKLVLNCQNQTKFDSLHDYGDVLDYYLSFIVAFIVILSFQLMQQGNQDRIMALYCMKFYILAEIIQ